MQNGEQSAVTLYSVSVRPIGGTRHRVKSDFQGTMLPVRTIVVAVAFALFAAGAKGQDLSPREPVASNNSARTLLGAMSGISSEGKDQSEDAERLDPDRPHFPEATTTVGNGRAVLESGYTFSKKGSSFFAHSYPEALLRVGMLADWFEFRIGQNFVSQQQPSTGVSASTVGAQDLYLGLKLAVTEQQGLLPAIALIPQITLPTGSRSVTAGRVLPGLNVDFSWDVIKDFFGIELLIANNEIKDALGGFPHELATGLTGVFQVTKELELFVEWDAFYPRGGLDSAGPQHYAVGGLVYFITPNLGVDARGGLGLNSRSNDFLLGVGFAARY
jgi:hypothetical protein